MKKLTLIAAASAALLSPIVSHAESSVNTAAVVGTVASAKLNLSVVIPSVLYLAVGTNSSFAANATVDNLVFTVPAANIGDSTVIAHGIDVALALDATRYAHPAGAYLFAAVLERFLGLYAAVNAFSRLTVRLDGRAGIMRRWPPRTGEKTLL